MHTFDSKDLKLLQKYSNNSTKGDNGQITIIGGSALFHGAPIMALKTASKFCDMVYFASPDKSMGDVVTRIKASLSTFIFVPWNEVNYYIEKSDVVLIGNGFMRFKGEHVPDHKRYNTCDRECQKTKKITERLLKKYPNKKWVIDAGSLQVIDPKSLPKGCIITPNKKEFFLLFNTKDISPETVLKTAKKYNITIVLKDIISIVTNGYETILVRGGNAGLTKGGTGDIQAGLTASFFSSNDAMLSASSASYLVKKTGDTLYEKYGTNYNSEDVIVKIPEVFNSFFK